MDRSIQYLGIDKRIVTEIGQEDQKHHKIEVGHKGEQCYNMFLKGCMK